jgi:hypothetical protein
MIRCVLTAIVLAVFALPAAALADGAYEPNNSASAAFGPLTGGSDYSAAIETENDQDWYGFYGFAQRQIRIHVGEHTITDQCGDGSGFIVTLRNAHGDWLTSAQLDSQGPYYPPQTVDLNYTLPRWDLYYLEVVDSGSGACPSTSNAYTFRIDPADALGGPPPPPPAPPGNDQQPTAHRVCHRVKRHHRHRGQSKYRRVCHWVYW